jgi:excisionase family DNA binding protein
MDSPEEWLSTLQAAELVHVNRVTIFRWIKSGRLVGIKLPGRTGSWIFRRADVLAASIAGEKPEAVAS